MLVFKRLLLGVSGCVLAAALGTAAPVLAQAGPEKPAEAKPVAAGITVAVLEFEGKDPANPDLGKNISEVLGAVLGAEDGFRLVERSQLEKKLQEQSISLTGLVDP